MLTVTVTLLQIEGKLSSFKKSNLKENHIYWTAHAWGVLSSITWKLVKSRSFNISYAVRNIRLRAKWLQCWKKKKKEYFILLENESSQNPTHQGEKIRKEKTQSFLQRHVTYRTFSHQLHKQTMILIPATEVLKNKENIHALRKKGEGGY